MNTRLLTVLLGFSLLGLVPQISAQLPLGAGGNYGGILEAGSDPDDSGILTVGLLDSGASTIRLVWQGQVYPLKARFDANGQVTRNFVKKNDDTDTELSLVCVLDAGSRTIGGVLVDPTASGGGFALSGQPPDTAALAQLPAGLRVAFIEPGGTMAAPEQGFAPAEIEEDGFAVVTVGKTSRRSTRFVGALPDSTKYSAGSPARGLQYALRAGLYSQGKRGSGGQLLGLGDVSGSSTAPAEGRDPRGGGGTVAQLIAALRWHKRNSTRINTNSFPGGLDQRVELDTVGYSRNRDTRFMLTGQSLPANATMRMTEGNLGTRAGDPGPNPITVDLNLTFLGARIVGPNPHRVKITMNPLTARFSGSFKHPDTEERMQFKGAFRSFIGVVPGEGRGNFLSFGPLVPRGTPRDPADAKSGSVRITVN